MKTIAAIALLSLAPLAQAGTPFAGRTLTPPAAYIAPSTHSVGVQVAPPVRPTAGYGNGMVDYGRITDYGAE